MPAPTTCALLLALFAAVTDLRSRRIPNWLTLPGLALAIAWHVTHGTWRTAALGFLLATLIYLPLWLAGGRGAGDLKLMAAMGAWLGPTSWIQLFVLTALVGGLWALGLIIAKRRVWVTLRNVFGILRSLLTGRPPGHRLTSKDSLAIPHAPIVALGMLLWLLAIRPLR